LTISPASKIELVNGRYVLAGEMVNGSSGPALASRLTLVYRKGNEIIGQHTYPLNEGQIAAGGRRKFSLPLDDPPAGVTQLAGTID
jgi:hypothetical protein